MDFFKNIIMSRSSSNNNNKKRSDYEEIKKNHDDDDDNDGGGGCNVSESSSSSPSASKTRKNYYFTHLSMSMSRTESESESDEQQAAPSAVLVGQRQRTSSSSSAATGRQGRQFQELDEYDMKQRPPPPRRHRESSWSRRRTMRITCMALGAVVVSIVLLVQSRQQQKGESSSGTIVILHKERLPTFFSLHDGDDYLYALDNPLYQALAPTATFHNDLSAATTGGEEDEEEADGDVVEISVKPSSIRSHDEPLRVTWTGTVHDDDILVFLCGDSDDDDDLTSTTPGMLDGVVQQFSDIVEVATLAQIKTTHRLNLQQAREFYGGNSQQSLAAASFTSAENNEWFIPYLPMVRQPACHFILYRPRRDDLSKRGDVAFTDYDYIASSNMLHVTSVLTPTMIHLAGSNNPTEMVVSFTTGGPTGRSAGYGNKPLAVYSPVAAAAAAAAGGHHQSSSNVEDERRVTGITTTYTANDLCSAPANITAPGQFVAPGLLHTVTMTELTPNTVYQYRVGFQNGQGVTWSDYFTFQAAPDHTILSDDDDDESGDFEPFAFLAYGDQGCPREGWGQGAAWTATMVANELNAAAANKVPVRAVHHFGDLSYAQGHAHQWDEWFQMIQPFAARVPLHVAVGNHEYDYMEGGLNRDPSLGSDTTVEYEDGKGFHPDWGNFENDSGGECGVPTSKRFTMPSSSSTDSSRPSSNGVFWYSHTFSAVHTIVLSAENDLGYGSPQHDWLVHELAAVNRTRTPWLVVEMHRPLYEGEAKWPENNVGIAHRQDLEDLFYDYNVDVVLAGHYHAYHRACDGLYQNVCDQGGPLHVTIGTAGALLDVEPLYKNDWSVVLLEKEYGYGRVSVHNRTHMHIEFVRAGAPDDDRAGQVLDDVWVRRDR